MSHKPSIHVLVYFPPSESGLVLLLTFSKHNTAEVMLCDFQDYIRIFAYHPEFLGMRALVILCFGTPVAYCEKLQPHAKVTCFPVVTSLTLAPS